MAKTVSKKTLEISKTLEDLGIDPEHEPEQAVAEAARELAGPEPEHTLASRLRAVPSVDAEDEDDDDESDEGGDDEEDEEDEEDPKPKAAPKGFAPFVSPKTRAKREAEKAAKEAKGVSAKIPDPLADSVPEFYAPPPPPTPFKSQKVSSSPAVAKMGALSKKLPGAEKIKVYKRVHGQMGHVADYTARDLEGFPDVESFLNRYVTPEYGFGEYELKGLDGYGREMNVGQVLLLGPPKKSEGDGAFSLVAQMMEQSQRQTAEWMNRMASIQSSSKPDQNPVSMMRDLMGLQEMLGKEAKETKAQAEAVKNAAMAESTNAMASMMQMFMASMQQQAQQTQQMMMLMMQPKEDPMMKILLAKLLEDKPSSGGMSMPPPPPPTDPLEGIAKLMAVLLPAIGAGGGGGGDEEVKELLKAQIQAREAERLGPKDLLAIMQEMKQERGTDDFKRSADNLAMMLNITNQLRSSTEGSPAAGFWDALGALFSNRDFAGSIAQTVRARAEDQQKAQLQAQNQQLALQRQALLVAEHKRRAAEVAAQGNALIPTSPPEKKVAPPEPAARTPVAPAKRARAAVREEPSLSGSVAPKEVIGIEKSDNAPPLPRLPANTVDHLKGIELAVDDAARIEKTVRMLIYFSGFPEWRPFTERLLGAAQAGEKTEMLQLLALFFQRFVDMGMFSMDEAKKTLLATKANFDAIYGELSQGEVLEEEKPEGPPDFLEVVDSTFDEEEDEDEDEQDDSEDESDEDEAEAAKVRNGKGNAAKASTDSILS